MPRKICVFCNLFKLNLEHGFRKGCLDSMEHGTVEWNSGIVEWWNGGIVEWWVGPAY